MFSSVGWGEIALLLIVALFVFGPDKLPGAVKQAGSALRGVRESLTGARKQLKDEFGDTLGDFDPTMLNPKQFVRKHLLEDLDEDDPVRETRREFGELKDSVRAEFASANDVKPVTTTSSQADQSAASDAPSWIEDVADLGRPDVVAADTDEGESEAAAAEAAAADAQIPYNTATESPDPATDRSAPRFDPDTT